MNRNPDNSDLWAAIRGLGMFSAPEHELETLLARHAGEELFASRVIAEAARQVLAIRRRTQVLA